MSDELMAGSVPRHWTIWFQHRLESIATVARKRKLMISIGGISLRLLVSLNIFGWLPNTKTLLLGKRVLHFQIWEPPG